MGGYITIQNVEIPEGAIGVWRIESLNINQAVYKGIPKDWQKIVNKEESALLESWHQANMICDHHGSVGIGNKGRWNMSNVRLGDYAMFITPNKKSVYECYLTALVNVNRQGYYSMNNKLLQPTSSKDIGCRCCVGTDSTRNYIAVFRYLYDSKL